MCTLQEKIYIMNKEENDNNTFTSEYAGRRVTALDAGR